MEYLKERPEKPFDYETGSVQMIGKSILRIRSNVRDRPHVVHFFPTYILMFNHDNTPYAIVHLEELLEKEIRIKLYVKPNRMKYVVAGETKYTKLENNQIKIIVKPGKLNYRGCDYFDYSLRDLEQAELAYLKTYKTTHNSAWTITKKNKETKIEEEECPMVDPSAFV